MKLVIKTPPAVEPVSLAQCLTQLRLDVTSPELASGNLAIGTYYLITATATNAFYVGCAIGDTFKAAAATTLTANNKVREIYEGAHLTSLITAARQYVENLCGPLVNQTWYQYLDAFPGCSRIDLRKPRVSALAAVKYTPDGAAASTFAATNYTLDIKDENKCRIVLNDSAQWPSDTLEEVNGVELEFTCGYGAAGSNVPECLRHAILLLVSNWYDVRLPVVNVTGNMVQVPFAVDALMANYRWWGF